MTTPEDCRRKAAQWQQAAEATSDANTSASMLRVSKLWTRLGDDIQKSGLSAAQMLRPRDLARLRVDAARIGEVLRDRLQISGEFDDSSDN